MTLEDTMGLLAEIEERLKDNSMTKEEAKELLEDVQRVVEIEDAAVDVAMKGLVIKGLANLMKLV